MNKTNDNVFKAHEGVTTILFVAVSDNQVRMFAGVIDTLHQTDNFKVKIVSLDFLP